MASPSPRPTHRRSLRKRRTVAVTAAVAVAGIGAGVFVMNANAGPVDLYHQVLPAKAAKAAKLLSGDGTGSIAGGGNLVNGTTTDIVAAYNAASSKKIKTTVNWKPALTAGLQTSAKNLLTELTGTTGAGALS